MLNVAGVRVVEGSVDVEDSVAVEDSVDVEDSVVESCVADRDEEAVVEDGEEDGEIDVTFTETLVIQPQVSSNAIHISKYIRNNIVKIHETHRARQLE